MTEARAFINPKMQNYHTLKAGLALSGNSASKFDVLNSHIYNSVVRSGELVIVGDWSTPSCTSQEAYLMAKAAATHMGLMRSGQGADEFFLENFELLKSLLAHASMGAGVVSDGWSRYLKATQDTLLEIEKLYQEHMSSGTFKARDQFYAKRAALFGRLDEQLSKMAAFGTSLRNQGSIKRTLGISTKSYLHTGEIAGYADKVAGVGKAANLIKKGTYLGISLEVASIGLDIQKACTLGRQDACRKAAYIEGASLAGSLGGAAGGAYLGSYAIEQLCIAIGVPTRGLGTLACAVIGGATGGMLVGDVGKTQGARLGELLYEVSGE
ncbi:hypothetical protein QVM62_05365 [Pseudomonas putida]|uniref:SSU ribosomal protein S2p (SAe) n=1 Tax=Pseudomonas putida (strain GB-1) TaxID=76869 RepID=B0KNE1_PSEPG|nr:MULTISPECIES: hypothetical protein [Pseudomonas]ABY96681.1 conserved hypothetical protein [Pseudomonas putida GB-1]MBP0706426.1 hypothetical protein [Pseudomonas sp. T34]MCK2185863.1 hypothetical protein [Pseudomonas sp. MB04B]MDD2084959.1 hypothetical protein [Pseudomonas putida]MDD2094932.1 hypothetical protein [Pseudomonas putida]